MLMKTFSLQMTTGNSNVDELLHNAQNNNLGDLDDYDDPASSDDIEINSEVTNDEENILFEPKNVLRYATSPVWCFFKFRGTKNSGPDKSKVQCNSCKAVLSYNSSTSTLIWHLETKHKKEYKQCIENEFKKKGNQPAITNYGIKQGCSSAKKWKKHLPIMLKPLV